MSFLADLWARIRALFGGEPYMLSVVRASEAAASQRAAERSRGGVRIYDGGGVSVARRDYVHLKKRGDDDYVEEQVSALDDVITLERKITFTLDYPFEREFAGTVEGQITLRRIVDAIRAGFDSMYANTTQEDLAQLTNKRVTGPYGTAFHVIGDLYIEGIALRDDGALEIDIGS